MNFLEWITRVMLDLQAFSCGYHRVNRGSWIWRGGGWIQQRVSRCSMNLVNKSQCCAYCDCLVLGRSKHTSDYSKINEHDLIFKRSASFIAWSLVHVWLFALIMFLSLVIFTVQNHLTIFQTKLKNKYPGKLMNPMLNQFDPSRQLILHRSNVGFSLLNASLVSLG